MKRNLRSAAYYRRKAWDSMELGHWAAADEWKRKAAKAAKREKARRAAAPSVCLCGSCLVDRLVCGTAP